MVSNPAVPKNRTNVRSHEIELQIVRAALRGASLVAPAAAELAGVELFFRPRKGRVAPPSVEAYRAQEITVYSGGYRLAAWSWGEGPTVLLVHGWEGRAAQLAPFVAPLVERGYRAVAFDQPAHGLSSGKRVTALDMARAVRDVAEDTAPLIGPRGLAPAPLAGVVAHSLGALATVLALRDGLSAARVVLLAPSAEPSYFARKAASFLGLSEPRTEGMVRRLREQLGGSFDPLDARVLARDLETPALVMHDPEDRDVPWEHGKAIADAWPGARFERLHELGHRRLLRDPAVIEGSVEFLTAMDA
jgi:pimeloyl-ACP methyl ester carboxylesterase